MHLSVTVLLLFQEKTSLRSKRFQLSYCAKVRAEAKQKVEGGGGGEKRRFLLSPPPPPSFIFFRSCPSFLDEPREETLATQAKKKHMMFVCAHNHDSVSLVFILIFKA